MAEGLRWEHLRPEQFNAEFERTPLVYWCCGAMEEHGLHNPLGLDPLSAHHICLQAAGISGGIVHPPICLAPPYVPGLSRAELRAGGHELYPPSLWVSREACELVYTELLESLADLGCRACIALGGHYPAEHLLGELNERYQGRLGAMRFWAGGVVALLQEVRTATEAGDGGKYGHGMLWETSLAMAYDADHVDLGRATGIEASPLVSQLKGQPPEHLRRITEATADAGQQFVARAAEVLATRATALLTAP